LAIPRDGEHRGEYGGNETYAEVDGDAVILPPGQHQPEPGDYR